jgi:hypothetical protein
MTGRLVTDGRLKVLCRCERKVVLVTPEDVWAGRTGKCSPACEYASPELARKARKL